VLVTVHEFGHYWVARRLGFKVLRFSVGFGKALVSRVAGRDQTEYVIAAIPLGGYVKLLDEREGPVEPTQLSSAYSRRPPWQRILVLLAGPFANFLFAVLAYWILFVAGVPALKPVIGEITPDSIAAHAGLHAGDQIVGVGGEETTSREGAVLEILDRVMSGDPIRIDVRAAGAARAVTLDVSRDRRRALTEPGALLPGLGSTSVPDHSCRSRQGRPTARRARGSAGWRQHCRRTASRSPISALRSGPAESRQDPEVLNRARRHTGGRADRSRRAARRRTPRRTDRRAAGGWSAHTRRCAPVNITARSKRLVAQSPRPEHVHAHDPHDLNVVTGDVSVKNLSGPIIAEYADFPRDKAYCRSCPSSPW
jgi:regulator of sigma E protease